MSDQTATTADPGVELATPLPEWGPVEPLPPAPSKDSYVSGDPQSPRTRARYYRRVRDNALVGKAWFGPSAEGHPLTAHGGAMAAVLDEAMGISCRFQGPRVVTARLIVEFRARVPIGSVVEIECFVERTEGRKAFPRGQLKLGGRVVTESSGLYVVPKPT
jgi:hypothetical protein